MRTYIIEIAAIDSAAKLLGKNLTDNYAVLGSLTRFREKNLGEVHAIKGIEDMEEKADSFRFGAFCGKILTKHMDALSVAEQAACEANTARLFLISRPVVGEKNDPEESKETLKVIVEAFVKRAQIRTHTAKPGSEDINTWLDRYNQMQEEYRNGLEGFAAAMLQPEEDFLEMGNAFINERDELVRSVLTGRTEEMRHALSSPAKCIFGAILREIIEGYVEQ